MFGTFQLPSTNADLRCGLSQQQEEFRSCFELYMGAVPGSCSLCSTVTFIERKHGASKLRVRVLTESAARSWRLTASRAAPFFPSAMMPVKTHTQ